MVTRAALLVSTGKYDDERFAQLRATAQDSLDLKRVLEDPAVGDYDVRLLSNPTRQELAIALEEFFDERAPDDMLLLYFSCHGMKDSKNNLYLTARDTQMNRLSSTAISAQYVQDCITNSMCKSVLVLLDCCYSGAFSRDKVPRAGQSRVDLGELPGSDDIPGRGTAVLTASTALEYAFEGSNEAKPNNPHVSYFTRAVVEGLESGDADQGNDGWVSVDELYDYVYASVRLVSPDQHPTRSMKTQGLLQVAKRAPRHASSANRGPEYFDVSDIAQIALQVDDEPELFCVTFSHDSKFLAAGAEDSALIWSLPTTTDAQPQYRLPHPRFVYSVAFSEDGAVLVTACEDGAVRFWDWQHEELLALNNDAHQDSVYSVSFSSQGNVLATGGYDGRVNLWNPRSRTVTMGRSGLGRVSSVALSGDGDTLAFATHDDKVWLWNSVDNLLQEMGSHQSSVECVALSSDGSFAVSCGLDKRVTVWDVAGRRSKWSPLPVHSYVVKSVAFSPNGKVIASAGWDQTVWLWDVASPRRRQKIPWVSSMRWHTDWIWCVAFSADGKTLATAGSDGLIVLMEFGDSQLAEG